MIFRWLYDAFLHLMAPFALPKMLYSRIRHKKYRESLPQRLGINYPLIEKKGKYLVWIHAVSVGETKAIVPLVKQIRHSIKDACIVISNITESGHAEAKRVLSDVDYKVYLPFDVPYIIKPIVRQAKPDLVILSETDFWFHFQHCAKEVGAKLALVNGKISLRSLKRYLILPWLSTQLFLEFDLLCVQNEVYRKRFMELGIAPDIINVTGNLKLDDVYPSLTKEEANETKQKLGIGQDDLVLVIGSTHNPEEKLFLDVLKKVWVSFPNLKLLLVPRHPERFQTVVNLLKKEKVKFARYSQSEHLSEDCRVMLVDAMGVLRTAYQIADLAIVAGSFTPKVGGHNLLEPSWYGVPVIYGPHVFTQQDLHTLIQHYQAGVQVNSVDLEKAIKTLLKDESKRKALGESGKKVFQDAHGATEMTWQALKKLISTPH